MPVASIELRSCRWLKMSNSSSTRGATKWFGGMPSDRYAADCILSNCARHAEPGFPSIHRSSAVQFGFAGILNEVASDTGWAHRAWEGCH